MRLLYFFTVAVAAAYYLAARRRLDLFTAAFASAIVYFLPGLWGYVLIPSREGTRLPAALVPDVYAVFILVIAGITVAAVLFDRLAIEPPKVRLPKAGVAGTTLALLACVGFLATLLSSGPDLFSHQKEVVLASLDRWHVLWAFSATLGTAVGFAARRWGAFAICSALLLFDLYVGFRSSLAVATIAVFVLWLGSRGRRRLISTALAPMAMAVMAASTFFVYKFLYRSVKQGDWGLVVDRLSDPGFFLRTIERSEPFTTQAILQQVFVHDFHASLADLKQVLYQLIVFAPELGANMSDARPGFRALFPDAIGGIGSNIWAEMWARGGWSLLLAFLVLFVSVLAGGSYLLRCRDSLIRGGVAVAGSFWAFYLHRNSLAYQLNLEKRIVLLWLFAVFVAMACAGLARRGTDGGSSDDLRPRPGASTSRGAPAVGRQERKKRRSFRETGGARDSRATCGRGS